jgi:hypothetical protein
MSFLISDQDNIKITLHVRSSPGRGLRVETDPAKVAEKEKADWKPITFTMKPLTWGIQNNILRAATQTDPVTQLSRTDWYTFKEKKLLNAIAAWDAKNGDKDIPVSPENILKLHPMVAETLLQEYDRHSYLDEDEKKV